VSSKSNGTPELEANWTLESGERKMACEAVTGANRLGFAVLYKYFQLYGRFPEKRTLLAPQIVEYLANQVGADPVSWADFDLDGRSAQTDRSQRGARPI